jgi:hypothetical protein
MVNPIKTTIERFNRFCLLKHYLINNSKRNEFVKVVKQICGLHAQIASSPYLSLWNRIEGFRTKDLSNMLYVEKKLVKICGMRGTLHIVPAEDLPIFHKALEKSISDKFEYFLQRRNWPISNCKEQEIFEKILDALENGPPTCPGLRRCLTAGSPIMALT